MSGRAVIAAFNSWESDFAVRWSVAESFPSRRGLRPFNPFGAVGQWGALICAAFAPFSHAQPCFAFSSPLDLIPPVVPAINFVGFNSRGVLSCVSGVEDKPGGAFPLPWLKDAGRAYS